MRIAGVVVWAGIAAMAGAAEGPARDEAEVALRRGVEFFRAKVAVEGSYLWAYSEDLARREGEGVAGKTVGWVQPPGTPSVGLAMLDAWEATGDRVHLDAALDAARALVRGQLRSGGWNYSIEFDPVLRSKFAYRDGGGAAGRNFSTLDDNTTQSAIGFLLRADRACGFTNEAIHRCVTGALEGLLAAQYPNGAWPQRFAGPPDAAKFPVKPASYPDAWPREWVKGRDYAAHYTFNDDAMTDTIGVLFDASRALSDPAAGAPAQRLAAACRTAAEKAGGFILLAQMPDPQPAWAQQYDADMHPAWARKFEPPAVTGGESQGILRALLRLYLETGQRRFLEPVPRAVDYLRRCRLPDGRLARFYELRTNTPLYFTKDYRLVQDDRDLPTHYAFKIDDGLDRIVRDHEKLVRETWKAPSDARKPPKLDAATRAQAAAAIAAQDAQGRWVESGGLKYTEPKNPSERVILSETFVRNVRALSRFLAATRIQNAVP